jgi:hypothetical protein
MFLTGAAWLLLAWFAPPGAPPDQPAELERFDELLRAKALDSAELPRLLKLCDELHERWKDAEADVYGGHMDKVLRELNEQLGWNDSGWVAVDDRILRTLKRQHEMELQLQEHLLKMLHLRRLHESRQKLGEESFQARRKAHAAAMLQTIAQAERERDESWDPEDLPSSNLAPPIATGLPSGVSPEAIKDPQLRAIYERQIEANWKKADRYRQQHQIRHMEQHFYPLVRQRWLARLYSPDELEELGRQCSAAGVSREWREKLFDEIRQAEK